MTRVLQCGLGAMGSLMARIALEKRGIELVGAVARRPELHGADLGAHLKAPAARGRKIYPDIATAARKTKAQLVMTATGSLVAEELPVIEAGIAAGLDVVSIAEEMAYPAARAPRSAARIDRLARKAGVTVLGTGINPGFVLDLLIITLTGVCRRVESIYAERVNDLSPYGGMVMQTQGIGLSPAAFRDGLKTGKVLGHIGFQQSVAMIADALGLELDAVREERAPIIAKRRRRGEHIVVPPGMVAGCRHTAVGLRRGRKVIELVHPQQIEPGAEGTVTRDRIVIKGVPNIDLKVEPEMAGGIGTASLAVNMVPLVAAAAPGLVSMKDLPVPRLAALRKS
ncbi:MAG TPA: 2,4-diaminopentanoate dehydrogenase [Planctomycetota bacterium]|nr:2,4-diaminopentanoate dehydrogenase [Planctomycetota bacterium]